MHRQILIFHKDILIKCHANLIKFVIKNDSITAKISMKPHAHFTHKTLNENQTSDKSP